MNPFYPILEAVLPYGKKLRSDVKFIHDCSRKLIQDFKYQVEKEELGEEQVAEGGEERGRILREFLATGVSSEDISHYCLQYIVGGEQSSDEGKKRRDS